MPWLKFFSKKKFQILIDFRFGIDVSKRTYSNGDANGGANGIDSDTNGTNGDSDGNKESKCCTIV